LKKFLPAIAWLIVVTILHCIPGKDIPKIGWLQQINFDKLVHLGIFALLVFIWCYSFFRAGKTGERPKKTFMLIAAAALIYGIGMELVQHYFISNRSMDIFDIAFDSAGILTGLLFSERKFLKK